MTSTTTGSTTITTPATCVKTHTATVDESCNSVASSAGTATWWLLLDNDLPAYCVNFTQQADNESFCIKHPCKTYTVRSTDSCSSVATVNNITVTQLQTWNPWINAGCYNFNETIGSELCVSQPGAQYTPPSTAIGSPSFALSAVPVPTNIAVNTTSHCGRYYLVEPGDYCDKLILKFGLSLADFLILNPAINANCTNLYARESYCVEPVGSINNYPGAPFYGLNNINPSGPAFTSLPITNYTTILPLAVKPLANGTSPNCTILLSGDMLNFNYSQVSDCYAVAITYDLTLSELKTLNPSLDVSSANCSFNPSYSYCVVFSGDNAPNPPTSISTGIAPTRMSTTSLTSTPSAIISMPSQVTFKPSPTQSGSIALNCNAYAKAVSGDDCNMFARQNKISPAQLYNWNSVLGVNGTNCASAFQISKYYCVGVAIPSPTQVNSIPANCDVYAKTMSDDGCYSFAQRNNITVAELYEWNTVLGKDGVDCKIELFLNYYYCVGVNVHLLS